MGITSKITIQGLIIIQILITVILIKLRLFNYNDREA